MFDRGTDSQRTTLSMSHVIRLETPADRVSLENDFLPEADAELNTRWALLRR